MQIPVYLFTGFLEAGKTSVICDSLKDPQFNAGEETLVILCEEGVEEYNLDEFPGKNITFVSFDDEAKLSSKSFTEIASEKKFERVIIEYNGMWSLDNLYKNLPEDFMVYQEVFVADSTTIEAYNANMRSLVVDKLQSCELVIFNRANDKTDREALHRLVRTVSNRTSIVFEYTDGRVEEDDIEDPLPFDINADVIEISDKDYAIWYRHLAENTDMYVGRRVKFKGIIAVDPSLKGKALVIGRHVMTCCADDIQYNGLVCKTDEAKKFSTRDWGIVVGKIEIEKHYIYQGKGPVIYAESIEPAEKPETEVATFY